MKIAIVADTTVDITPLLLSVTWSGDRAQAARKLEFSYLQDDRDPLLPQIGISAGYTVVGGDDDGNVVFIGNVYSVEVDRQSSRTKILAYDHAFILNRSKTSRKFTGALPEDIARDICETMGVKIGDVVSTGTPVSFIANGKTGYQIIQGAYYEAYKINNNIYHCVMEGDKFSVGLKGTLCGVTLNAAANMTGSVYRESIEDLINVVQIVDEQGNASEVISNPDSVERYSAFMDVYKTQKDKDAQVEARALLNIPEYSGTVTALGDYRAKAGYSLVVKDTLFSGQFFIKSDVHTWQDGVHEMKLVLEFENIMTEQQVEKAK